jgi:hypothetical protein
MSEPQSKLNDEIRYTSFHGLDRKKAVTNTRFELLDIRLPVGACKTGKVHRVQRWTGPYSSTTRKAWGWAAGPIIWKKYERFLTHYVK